MTGEVVSEVSFSSHLGCCPVPGLLCGTSRAPQGSELDPENYISRRTLRRQRSSETDVPDLAASPPWCWLRAHPQPWRPPPPPPLSRPGLWRVSFRPALPVTGPALELGCWAGVCKSGRPDLRGFQTRGASGPLPEGRTEQVSFS